MFVGSIYIFRRISAISRFFQSFLGPSTLRTESREHSFCDFKGLCSGVVCGFDSLHLLLFKDDQYQLSCTSLYFDRALIVGLHFPMIFHFGLWCMFEKRNF